MNKLLLVPLFVLICSCEGGVDKTDAKDNNKIQDSLNKVEDESDKSEVKEMLYAPVNEDGIWQINDYAELFVGEKIYRTPEDIPADLVGGGNYYESLDVEGGFASVTGAYEGWSEFVLWRMKNGKDLLGKMVAGCGPVCGYVFEFYQCQNEETVLLDFQDILPVAEMDKHRNMMYEKILAEFDWIEYPDDYQYIYNLPEKGTSMEVDLMVGADEVFVPILNLGWNKERFYIIELFDEVKQRTY
jgi:hypothetical protein